MRILLLTLVIGLLGSCEKDDYDSVDPSPYLGEWQWLSSGGSGWGQWSIEHEPDDEPLILTIAHGGRYSVQRGEGLLHQGTYKLRLGPSIFNQRDDNVHLETESMLLSVESLRLYGVIRIDGDSMHITPNMYDAGGSLLSRTSGR
jgi:hypothetical protein